MATSPDLQDPAVDAVATGASGRLPPSALSAEMNPPPLRIPSLRSSPDPSSTNMSASSNPLGMLNSARKPASVPPPRGGGIPQSMQEKMKQFHLSRQGTPASGRGSASPLSPTAGGIPLAAGGLPTNLRLPPNVRPPPQGFASAPTVPKAPNKMSLSERRKMNLPGGLPPMMASVSDSAVNTAGVSHPVPAMDANASMFSKFSNYVDTKNGVLRFAGKAVIHGQGIDFSSGSNFNISLDEVDTMEELGKGNYGTVFKVRHARPRMRRVGHGLHVDRANGAAQDDASIATGKPGTSGVIMAMKEIRLELDEAKFAAIIMELDILHRCISPYIIDFYGAFFQEGAVYICIEFMDGGSIDKLYGDGIPENVLRKITYATTQGLRTLKDDHNIIHRDVKPTNILVNTRGQVKICDFGVSGNLVASIAKTNIGCQSYMAPERISGGGMAQPGTGGGTYSVQSDIWSLGLTIIECAMGQYPYPPETYDNIFSQLSAIVEGDPPDLPTEGYSDVARDFVRGCLNKVPKLRLPYSMLLQHRWLASLSKPDTIEEASDESEADADAHSANGTTDSKSPLANGEQPVDREVADWVIAALEKKLAGSMSVKKKPALHAAPLDAVSPTSSPSVSKELSQ